MSACILFFFFFVFQDFSWLVIGCAIVLLSVCTLPQLLPECFHSCTCIPNLTERMLEKMTNLADHFDVEMC